MYARARHHEPGKGSVLEPSACIFFRVETGHRRHGPRSQAVTVEDAHAAGAFYGPSGLGVEQVAILLAFVVDPPGIVTACGDGCV